MTKQEYLSWTLRRSGLRYLPIIALFVLSCAGVQPSDAVDEVVRLREKCEELDQAIGKGYYDSVAKGKLSNQARTHKDFEYLLVPSKLELLDRRFSSSSDPDEKEAVSRLKLFLISKTTGFKKAGVMDDILNYSLETTITIGESSVPYRNLNFFLSNEKERDARRRVYLASATSFEADNVLMGQLVAIEAREAKAVGYSDYMGFYSAYRDFDPAKMEEAAKGFLAATDSMYATLLEEVSMEVLSLGLSDFRFYDLPRIMRMERFDQHFDSRKLLDTVSKTFEGMGLAFKKQSGLALTIDSSPKMMEGAYSVPVFVPLDVRLSRKAVGGASDYASLFHVGAMALMYSNTREDIFEFKTLGSHAAREGYGYLFEFLLDDPGWLEGTANMSPEDAKAYAKLRAFVRLFEARSLCGVFLFQLTLLEGPEKAKDSYAETMTPVLKISISERDALRGIRQNDFFYVADRMRGLFLEPHMRAYMRKQFGEDWFKKPDAGRYLLSKWSGGQKPKLAGVAQELGADPLDWKPALAELQELLARGY